MRIFIVFAILTAGWAHECAAQVLMNEDSLMAALTADERQALRRGAALNSEGKYGEAAAAVESLGQRSGASPMVYGFLAVMNYRAENYDGTVKWCDKAEAALGPRMPQFPTNLQLPCGFAALELDRFQQAIARLERAREHPEYSVLDPEVYGALALAYAQTREPQPCIANGIATAYLMASDTSSRIGEGIRRLCTGSISDSSTAQVSTLIRRLGRFKSPSEWAFQQVSAALEETSSLIQVLQQEGYRESVAMLRRLAIYSGLRVAQLQLEQGDELKTLQVVGMVDEHISLDLADRRDLDVALSIISKAYIENGEPLQAVDEIGRRVLTRDSMLTAPEKLLLQRLARMAFTSVSFDPETGELREIDRSDFAGNLTEFAIELHGLPGPAAETPSGRRGSTSDSSHTHQNRYPYGMVNDSEDRADMGSILIGLAADHPLRLALKHQLQAAMRARNFELPVKAFLVSVDRRAQDPDSLVGNAFTPRELRRALESATAPQAAETTRAAFEVGWRVNQLFLLDRQHNSTRTH